MKLILGIGEWLTGVLVNLFTLPFLILGFFTGLRGGARYFKIKSM